MKRYLFCIVIIIISHKSYCQESKNVQESHEKSKVETFSLKTGSLIKKEFIEVGTIKKVEIKSLKITDMLAKTSISGIKLETDIYKSYGNTTKSCFLDSDEIDGFIKSGKLLIEALATGNTTNYTEFQFTSRDGFQAGAFSNDKGNWSFFLKLEKFDSDSYVFLNKEEFEKILSTVEDAKAKL
jgi:hypothetical protein